jgi:hypothetical protein
MMKMQAFRVREVLRGHSSASAVVGEDAQGREIRLEVGALEGASIQPGELLVLNWATVQVPPAELGVTPRAEAPRSEPVEGRAVEDVEIVTAEEAPQTEPREELRALDEFRALIGLQ